MNEDLITQVKEDLKRLLDLTAVIGSAFKSDQPIPTGDHEGPAPDLDIQRGIAIRLATQAVPLLLDEIEAATGSEGVPSLLAQALHYLKVRGHVVNAETPYEQARYVMGEAHELLAAVEDAIASYSSMTDEAAMQGIRHEIADVVISTTVLARMLGVTVERCIAEKTHADRGRG